ncbi:MAG: acyl carrier protein [Tissierellia bacterium]|nr:acyl carrier protein [Tissierellia bacterium]
MKDKILEIITEQFNVNIDEIGEDTSFADDLNADSIQLMELVMTIEEEFDIEISEDEILSIETIGDVVDYIENL